MKGVHEAELICKNCCHQCEEGREGEAFVFIGQIIIYGT